MRRYRKYNDLAVQHVELPADEFDALCDHIDTLYDMLEAENESLSKRVDRYELGNKVIVNVKMRIDWESMAEELERAAETVRTLEEGDKE
jgi:hypothetical protein